jgi:ASC-1-like (ASCH) protein
MDHVAIMNKKLGSIPQILSCEKTIESRWYLSRKAPWHKVKKGDTIFFKNSGEPVTVKAKVKSVKEFEFLQPQKVREILKNYGAIGKLNFDNVQKTYQIYKNNKYCILVFLKNPTKVKPFNINKSGFGISSAWLCVGRIASIKKH